MTQKRKKLTAVQRLSNVSEIPLDMTLCLPYIRMCSNREIIIEDAGKLVHYDADIIKLMQGKIKICISGSGLKLKYLLNKSVRVTGFILSVSFE